MKAEAKKLKEIYQSIIRKSWEWPPLETNVTVNINLIFGDAIRRDVDNYCKLIFDAMEWIVYVNDNQIQTMIVKKFIDRENPRVEIRVVKL